MKLSQYEDLCLLEPRLVELEREVRAIRDDGSGSFFCSNYLWMPIYGRLKAILGVGRRVPEDAAPEETDPDERALELAETGEEDEDEGAWLASSQAFEIAYVRLSSLMPPCRGCGCRKFLPVLEEQLSRH